MEIEIAEGGEPLPRSGLELRDGWPRARGLLSGGHADALDERVASSRERGGVVRVARRAGKLVGAIVLRESPWDAEGLGVRAVGTVDLVALARGEDALPVLSRLVDALDDFSRERKTALDWLRADAGDASLQDVLLRRGFRAVELIFSLVRESEKLAPPAPAPRGVQVRRARAEDASWLRSLSASSFTESRFSDKEGPEGWNALVYSRWIDARMAQASEKLAFLVAEVDSEPAGFLIWKVHATPGASGLTGQVDLVAVSPRARGRGVGRALLDEARRISPPLAWVAADVYARNPLGLALHQRYGLEVAAASTYLHRWHEKATA